MRQQPRNQPQRYMWDLLKAHRNEVQSLSQGLEMSHCYGHPQTATKDKAQCVIAINRADAYT